MKRILLIEDDRSLGEILSERLLKEGYNVDWIREVAKAEKMTSENYDLFIIDINLPDGSGFEIAKSLKKKSGTPFVFMTALSDPETRLAGFELGAEEFIPKPFHLKELLLRVAHVLQNHRVQRQLKVANCIVDFDRKTVETEFGEVLYPPAKDLELLHHLILRAPDVVSRDELLNLLWGQDKDPSHRTIDNMVVRLRDLLGADDLIRAVRGIGYQWSGGKWQI